MLDSISEDVRSKEVQALPLKHDVSCLSAERGGCEFQELIIDIPAYKSCGASLVFVSFAIDGSPRVLGVKSSQKEPMRTGFDDHTQLALFRSLRWPSIASGDSSTLKRSDPQPSASSEPLSTSPPNPSPSSYNPALFTSFFAHTSAKQTVREFAVYALVFLALGFLVQHVGSIMPWRTRCRVECAARHEERRTRRAYRNAARRLRWERWWRRQLHYIKTLRGGNSDGTCERCERCERPIEVAGMTNQGRPCADAELRRGNLLQLSRYEWERARGRNRDRDRETLPPNTGTGTGTGTGMPYPNEHNHDHHTRSYNAAAMQDEIIGFRRVLDYVGELIRPGTPSSFASSLSSAAAASRAGTGTGTGQMTSLASLASPGTSVLSYDSGVGSTETLDSLVPENDGAGMV